MTFDSIREFERYQELALLEKAGTIRDLECQVPVQLKCGGNPVMQRSGRYWKTGRKVQYFADFKYWDNEFEKWRWEDVKGYDTPLSALKRAVVEAEDGILIEIVR